MDQAAPDTLYDRDILAWSEHQAALLRRLAAGERLNDTVDWPNVIEEVESVGRAELHSVESLLMQAILHLLKISAWPGSRSVAHWRPETIGFLLQARRRFSPSMPQRIDLADIYADALQQFRGTVDDSGAPLAIPDSCPCSLDDLLGGDVPDLLRRIDPTAVSSPP